MNSTILIREQDSLLQDSQIKEFLDQSIINKSIVSSIHQGINSKNINTPPRNNKILTNLKCYSLTTLKPKNLSINVSNLRMPSRLSKLRKQQMLEKQGKQLKKSQQINKRFYPNKIINNEISSSNLCVSFKDKDKSTMPSFYNSSAINPQQLKISLLRKSRIQKNERKTFFSLQEINKRQTSTLMNLNKITNQFFFTHNNFFQKRKYQIKTNICLTKKLMISQTKLNQLTKQRKGVPINPFKRSFRQSDYIQT